MNDVVSVNDEMKKALHKRAVGYDVEETYASVDDDGKKRVVKRKRHIPGDPKAIVEYLRLYGNEGGWN